MVQAVKSFHYLKRTANREENLVRLVATVDGSGGLDFSFFFFFFSFSFLFLSFLSFLFLSFSFFFFFFSFSIFLFFPSCFLIPQKESLKM